MLTRLLHRFHGKQPKRRPSRQWLTLEALETRCVPSTITVTTLSDAASHTGTSLRDAITEASFGDTITFQEGLSGTIDLSPTDGGQGTLTINTSVDITGPSNLSIAIEGGQTAGVSTNVRIFDITSSAGGTYTNLVFKNGYASSSSGLSGDGGGVYNAGPVDIDNCVFTANIAAGDGGGLYSKGALSVSDCTFTSNSAADGGGIASTGSMGVSDSLFNSNSTAAGGTGVGGGIYNDQGSANVSNSTLVNNTAYYGGGGIANPLFLSLITVTNDTIVDNTVTASTSSGGGGGVYATNSGNVKLINTLLSGNTAGDYKGPAVSTQSDNNIIQVDAGSGLTNGTNGNIIGAGVSDVGLDPSGLQNNGGPTETIALVSGSQAIHAGNNSVLPANDQRGVARETNDVDIGAYQTELALTPTTLPTPALNAAYSESVSAAGGTGPYTYAITYGSLPSGITLSSSGSITGSTTAAGTYNFVIAATDSSDGIVGSQLYSFTILPGPVDLAESTLTATHSTLNAGGTTTLTLKLKDQYGNNTNIGVSSVHFATTDPIGTYQFTNQTNGSGVYTVTYQEMTAGSYTLSAYYVDSSNEAHTVPQTVSLTVSGTVEYDIRNVSSGVYLFTSAGGWRNINGTKAAQVALNSSGDVLAAFAGNGVYRYELATGWIQLTTNTNVTQLSVDAEGDVLADFTGYGLWRYENGSGWLNLNTVANVGSASLDAHGDVVAVFPGNGLWRYKSGAWAELSTNSNVTMVSMNASGEVLGNFVGYGLWLYENGTGWVNLHTISNVGGAALNDQGDVVALLTGAGIWRYESGSWQQLTTNSNGSMLSIDSQGDVLVALAGNGVWRYEDATKWQNLSPATPAAMFFGATGDVLGEFSGQMWLYSGGWTEVSSTIPS